MPLTKEDIVAALRTIAAPGETSASRPSDSTPGPKASPGMTAQSPESFNDQTPDLVRSGVYQWSAVCESFVSVKLNLPRTIAAQELRRLAVQVDTAVRNRAASPADGVPVAVTSMIVECVDDGGTVFRTERFGSAGEPAAPATAPSPAPAPAPSSAPAAPAPASAAPAQAPAADGHRPIRVAGEAPTPQQSASGLEGVSRIIAVGAGKGGVGKSSIAINLAVALARRGRSVGLLDGDIYGPSFPTMLGLDRLEQATLGGKLEPFLVHGVKAITIGKLVSPDKPLIWRGPMAHGAFKQLADQTNWGELDDLIIDLPPGTGDISLTMAQTLKLTGAVVVCTPQRVAQDDAVRAARMFQQLGIEVLGVVENMSYFVGDDGKEYDIFGRGGAEHMAQRLGVPFLGSVPICMTLRRNSDTGDASANFDGVTPDGALLKRSLELVATNLEAQATMAAMKQGVTRPVLKIS
jgi:ATP-binding protein involved in chromosome partitioning